MSAVRDMLRELPVLGGRPPLFDAVGFAETRVLQFISWLATAIDGGVTEPHAMTLSSVDAEGMPDARVLILKDVDDEGWHFAVQSTSPKGWQVASNRVAALTFYWPAQVRQIRLRGIVRRDPEGVRLADFRARSASARALAITGAQSEPLDDAMYAEALSRARRQVDDDPEFVPDEWISYALRPRTVEFWQGAPDRQHHRIRYERRNGQWSRTVLRP